MGPPCVGGRRFFSGQSRKKEIAREWRCPAGAASGSQPPASDCCPAPPAPAVPARRRRPPSPAGPAPEPSSDLTSAQEEVGDSSDAAAAAPPAAAPAAAAAAAAAAAGAEGGVGAPEEGAQGQGQGQGEAQALRRVWYQSREAFEEAAIATMHAHQAQFEASAALSFPLRLAREDEGGRMGDLDA